MKRLVSPALAAACLAAASLAPLPAHALFGDDEARKAIVDLRGKFEAFQKENAAQMDGKANQKSVLDLANQNEQLRQEVARLRGQLEVLSNELANAQQRQKDFYVDLDNRLRKLEPQRVTFDGKEISVDPAEQKSYDAALASFNGGDYKAASVALADFVRRFPQSGYAANAQYLLGNSFYALRDYRNAMVAQQAVVKNFPDHAKAPDALLNIATCQLELKDRAATKKTLESLVAKYPEAPAAKTAKERLAILK
ncbi:tol-pal system protein YbgF [Noviherbaspirillum sedimenti]|uniref:Cell division coordinator CpoB n=1 Tax=Noviherbaspirillum sedimenti TaxID=2320865 RepID=A0A3A3G4N4_9BURK|nr:tol-pal system protein YbgF [Noviherbaspirillum sedimenti]RJG01739.1 tol-pal system protein YbgF [Noviherbaspirillum sedimenti]